MNNQNLTSSNRIQSQSVFQSHPLAASTIANLRSVISQASEATCNYGVCGLYQVEERSSVASLIDLLHCMGAAVTLYVVSREKQRSQCVPLSFLLKKKAMDGVGAQQLPRMYLFGELAEIISQALMPMLEGKTLAELAWGAELPEQVVRDVVAGRRDEIGKLARIATAGGVELRFEVSLPRV